MVVLKNVGQAILPAAAFQAALSGESRIFKRRLKAGGSQDWLPHFSSSIDSARSSRIDSARSSRIVSARSSGIDSGRSNRIDIATLSIRDSARVLVASELY
jgi:hypothetical protein